MYKISLDDMYDLYCKGFVDGLKKDQKLKNGQEVLEWLRNAYADTDYGYINVGATVTDMALESWKEEIIEREDIDISHMGFPQTKKL